MSKHTELEEPLVVYPPPNDGIQRSIQSSSPARPSKWIRQALLLDCERIHITAWRFWTIGLVWQFIYTGLFIYTWRDYQDQAVCI